MHGGRSSHQVFHLVTDGWRAAASGEHADLGLEALIVSQDLGDDEKRPVGVTILGQFQRLRHALGNMVPGGESVGYPFVGPIERI